MAKRILDEKARQALLGYVPFSSDCKIQFTPDEFKAVKDESLRPIFEVRSLTQSELSQLKHNSQSLLTEAGKVAPERFMAIANSNLNVIRASILGWTNLFDVGTREEIEFAAAPTGGCDEKLFEALPLWIKQSILNYVKQISGLTDPENFSIK